MSRKFSNKRIVTPKPKKVKNKGKKNPKPAEVRSVDFNSQGENLFLIMASHKNKQYNIDSSLETWIKTLGPKNDYCFVLDSPMKKINHFTAEVGGKYKKSHDAYSTKILLELFKQKMPDFSKRFNNICFCTDTTYINVNNFNADQKHWGYVSALLPSSVDSLRNIDNRTAPEEVKMYHGEAGFCLNSEIAREIGSMLSKNDNLILDRWDSTMGYCMHKLGAILNHDDRVNLFPHTILNHSSNEIKSAKSYGYLKFYDKKNVFDTLTSKK